MGPDAGVTCPGCRVTLPALDLPWDHRLGASPECGMVYGEVVGFELAHLELAGRFHQLTVDAYGAQHARRGESRNIRVAYSLVGLHLALDRGLSGLEVRSVHQGMGRPTLAWPAFSQPPDAWALTVLDVALAGTRRSSPQGHATEVERWAAVVWNSWSAKHQEVAELADRLLASGAVPSRRRGPRRSR